jgi:hypothetical protein
MPLGQDRFSGDAVRGGSNLEDPMVQGQFDEVDNELAVVEDEGATGFGGGTIVAAVTRRWKQRASRASWQDPQDGHRRGRDETGGRSRGVHACLRLLLRPSRSEDRVLPRDEDELPDVSAVAFLNKVTAVGL